MKIVKYTTQYFCCLVSMLLLFHCSPPVPPKPTKVLVFSKTAGFRHNSIGAGVHAVKMLGTQNNFEVVATENSDVFAEENLRQYGAVVFLNTTGDVLNDAQQRDFERFIQAGGGFVGVHAASDTEYDWPWYGKLVGAYFKGHPSRPNVRNAILRIRTTDHPSTAMLAASWPRKDEWYNFKNMNPAIKVLINLDETTYEGGTHGENHPIAWYHEYDGGRAFYTASGHTRGTYSEPLFLQHLLGGIKYAIGKNKLNYKKASSKKKP